MKIINKISELRKEIINIKNGGKKIGFVPTMGYLHEGHSWLMQNSVENNDITVLSIFVNPIQFGVNEDFSIYPRDFEHDVELAKSKNVDILFAPNAKEIYPDGFETYVNVEYITKKLCGKTRINHFRGVTTVVLKLLNIVTPDNAYFGQKDFQQYIVIKKMVEDLNLNINILPCSIIREKDGLALSSRNIYLDKADREKATSLYASLMLAKDSITAGEKNKGVIIQNMKNFILEKAGCKIEYIEILNADNLSDTDGELQGRIVIALAARYGNTRLIDNIMVEV